MFLSALKIGEKAVIKDFNPDLIPLKLIELGCLPDKEVELVQVAPLGCPMYFIMDDNRVAIRREIANEIQIEKL